MNTGSGDGESTAGFGGVYGWPGRRTKLLDQPKFYWASAFALVVLLLGVAVRYVEFDKTGPDVVSSTQAANLRTWMAIVCGAVVVAWFGYIVKLYRTDDAAGADLADGDLFIELLEECRGMAIYALQRGIKIDREDTKRLQDLVRLVDLPAPPRNTGPTGSGDGNKGGDADANAALAKRAAASAQDAREKYRAAVVELQAQRLEAVPLLTDSHQRLATAVAPAMPKTLRLLNPASAAVGGAHNKPFAWLGQVALVRRLVGLVLVLIPLFIALAVSVGTRLDEPANLFTGNVIIRFQSVAYLLTASATGAAFAALFKAFRYIENLSYDDKWEPSYWVRFILGLVAGVILSTIVAQSFFSSGNAAADGSSGSTVKITIPLLALVGGFSSDLVYRILKRVIDAIETLVRGSTSERVELEQLKSAARKEHQDLVNRKELSGEIMQLRTEMADNPTAQAALDRSLARVLDAPPPVDKLTVLALSAEESRVEVGSTRDLQLDVGTLDAAAVVAAVAPPTAGDIARSDASPTVWTFTGTAAGAARVLFAVPDTREQAMIELAVVEASPPADPE